MFTDIAAFVRGIPPDVLALASPPFLQPRQASETAEASAMGTRQSLSAFMAFNGSATRRPVSILRDLNSEEAPLP
jgi:hypothetical protein